MPAIDVAAGAGAGVRKPPVNEPAGVQSAVPALWGFDGIAWFAGAARMRLASGNDAVGVRARPTDAMSAAAWLSQSGRFQRGRPGGSGL
jgi:hypothetical protein